MLKLTYIAVLQDLNTSPYWFCNINKLDKDLNVNSPEVSQFPELSSHLINVIYRGFHTVGFQLLSLQWTVLFSRLSGALEINVLTNYITGSAWYSTKFDMNSGLPQGYVSVYIADCPRGKSLFSSRKLSIQRRLHAITENIKPYEIRRAYLRIVQNRH